MTGQPGPRPPGRRETAALQHLSRGAYVQGVRHAARHVTLVQRSDAADRL